MSREDSHLTDQPKLNLVICWHMHQPYYRDGLNGEFVLPWVYLHAIKDYDDMVAHLERYPKMKVVVNFAPVLLEQIDEYARQIDAFIDTGTAMSDSMLNLLAGVTPVPDTSMERKDILLNCSRAHAARMIEPFPVFKNLLNICECQHEKGTCRCDLIIDYLSQQFFLDLITWYHIAWMSHSLKQSEVIQQLIKKGGKFNQQDRRTLVQTIGKSLAGIIPRYKALSESGQIELSMTPYGHPMIPLLNSFENMLPIQPNDPLPIHPGYPGGRERSVWHLQKGLQLFDHYFGIRPKGVWLSEGGVSEDALELLDEMDIKWTATGEQVWYNSYRATALAKNSQSSDDGHDLSVPENRDALFIPYRLNNGSTKMFFRDDGLSDLIGFQYSNWHADDAVANFVNHLGNIRTALNDSADQYVVSVILDGENAWEYYPENGRYFLDKLYKTLSESDAISVQTFAEISEAECCQVGELSTLIPGSWVYGSFSTWIGSEDKNHAWDLLVQAKQQWDEVVASKQLNDAELAAATKQLAICEGSDWFWWFGNYNPSNSVSDFDKLYRHQLITLYQLLKVEPPALLQQPISQGDLSESASENSGTMRKNS